jgi:ABC-2 type transport system ATP-binding protein
MTHVLEFHQVWRHFGAREVLRGLSFVVKPGEVYALLGRNGEGKTTAIRILLGFLEPHAGEARLLGERCDALPLAVRGRVGYVSEGHRLYAEMRVREAVRFERDTRPGFDASAAAKELARLALDPAARITTLSRGQRAQLALVLACAGAPEVLVFDDPAMGLDVAMRRELLESLIALLAERGTAVLFSTHILPDVERLADRVGILKDGALIVDAPLDVLKRRVEKRQCVPINGAAPQVDGLLRARRLDGGYELTLLDFDPAREHTLRAGSRQLSEPLAPDLEELFLDLTARKEATS